MSKSTIIIDGASVTASLGGNTISDIVSVSFSLFGERPEIDLTTIDATKYKMKLLGDLQKISDVVITKKSDPENDADLYSTDSEALVIAYKIGKSGTRNLTMYGQLKSISNSTVERAPSDGVNVDLNIYITNLSSLTETAPAITTP